MKRFIAILQTDLDRAGAVGDGLLLGFLGVLAVSCLPTAAELADFGLESSSRPAGLTVNFSLESEIFGQLG